MNHFYLKFLKRIADICLSLLGLLLFLICYLFFIVIYSFGKDKGPVLFKQKRLGLGGKEFTIYKFRSMRLNAEQILQDDPVLYSKYIKNGYKLLPNEDPRLTSIGNFIRKTSIDELPQFINVIKGDMSLIGPRPILSFELDEYSQKDKILLLSIRPGITGWWQVSGRSDVGYPERCQLELYYVKNISFMLDVKIIFLTIKKVIFREGAF